VVDGCWIRELPDGGREFVLDEPSLSFIRIDDQSRLQFGDTEVVIDGPFEVVTASRTHYLDPRHTDSLGPLVSLFPGEVRWLWTSAHGDLTAVFASGVTVTVSPDPFVRAWSVGNVYCLPTQAAPPD
jgi:hypothetical protein